MSVSKAFYQDAARLLCITSSKTVSLKNAFFNRKITESKAVYALVVKCLGMQPVIIGALKGVGALKTKDVHIKSSNSGACTTCLLTVVAFDVSCPRRSFGSRKEALRLLNKCGLSTKIASDIRKAIKNDAKKAVLNDNIITKIPVYLRATESMDKVIDTLLSSNSETFSQILFDRGTTSHTKFIKIVQQLHKGEFIRDYHFPDLLLLFRPGTDLHLSPVITYKMAIIQDKASCLPPLVLLDSLNLPCPEPIKILDSCAAPGNKTTLLLLGLKDLSQKGRVVALDRDKRRFIQLCKNLGEFHDGILTVNGNVKNPKAPSDIVCDARLCDFLSIDPSTDESFFDIKAILVDPSCTGSGLRCKCPELMFEKKDRQNAGQTKRIERLAGLQAKILRHALSFPSVQVVVYSTCSIYQEENEGVILDIINSGAAKNFELVSIWRKEVEKEGSRNAPSNRFTPQSRWDSRGHMRDVGEKTNKMLSKCLRSSTEKELTIGFFVACFKRKKWCT